MVALAGLAQTSSPLTSAARAGIDPVSGIDFVRIGAVGNAPWPGANPPIPGDMALGRGSVVYEYHIGRFEVSTAQWVEFYNAAFDRPRSEWVPWLVPPTQTRWGAVATTPNTPDGLRWRVQPGNEMIPTGNISWRAAAIYCNWLHNGKSLDRNAFLNGAYDVSTFGGGLQFTDQFTHHPDARYWIPTWDEWLKAAHYDPDKNGPDQGGWWLYSNGTDSPLTGGPPGQGQANFGFVGGAFTIPLGAYPQTQSPWGLFDIAGATAEWTEGILSGGQGTRWRLYEGSAWAGPLGDFLADAAFTPAGADVPTFDPYSLGFRIASAVPTPPSAYVLTGAWLVMARRRRRAETRVQEPPFDR